MINNCLLTNILVFKLYIYLSVSPIDVYKKVSMLRCMYDISDCILYFVMIISPKIFKNSPVKTASLKLLLFNVSDTIIQDGLYSHSENGIE